MRDDEKGNEEGGDGVLVALVFLIEPSMFWSGGQKDTVKRTRIIGLLFGDGLVIFEQFECNVLKLGCVYKWFSPFSNKK